MEAVEQLSLYRSRHVIRPNTRYAESHDGVETRRETECAICGIRIHERRSRSRRPLYLHSADEIKRLVRTAR